MSHFADLMRQIEEKNAAAAALIDSWGEAVPSKAQQEEVKALNHAISELEKQAVDTREGDALRQQIADRKARLGAPVARPPFPTDEHPPEPGSLKTQPDGLLVPAKGQSWGDAFTGHPEIESWQRKMAPNGHFLEKQRVQSPVMGVRAHLKTLITGVSQTSAGALLTPDMQPLVSLPFRPLTIRDVITIGTTGTDTVEYPRVTGYTNAAAPVAEAIATGDGSGAKPESALALEKVTTAVKTVAHWVPATKRALADAGQLRTLIDNFLIQGLAEELEDQVIGGDGNGENFLGLANTPGLTPQAFVTNILTTARKAVTTARVTGRARPTGWLMNPTDWEAFDLLQDNEARYYYGGPQALGNPRLWGFPVIESEAVAAGVAYFGDLRQIVVWDREQATIQISTEHADFFIRNMVAVLAELRAAMGVFRPAAIVEVDLTA